MLEDFYEFHDDDACFFAKTVLIDSEFSLTERLKCFTLGLLRLLAGRI